MYSQSQSQMSDSVNKLKSSLFDIKEFNKLLKQPFESEKSSKNSSNSINNNDKSDNVLIDKELLEELIDCYNNCKHDNTENNSTIISEKIIENNVNVSENKLINSNNLSPNENFNIYDNPALNSLKNLQFNDVAPLT
ncbi:MdBV-7-1 [Microplitis demolitor]|nr:MdBV-7-1 [Microplitis demolitor]